MLAFLLAVALTSHAPVVPADPPGANGDITGVVRDSTSGQGLTGSEVLVLRGGQVVARTETDAFGRYRIHNLPDGDYDVEVRLLGFRPSRTHITVGPGGEADVSIRLAPSVVQLREIEARAPTPIAVDTRTGNQIFQQDVYHGAPTQTTSQIVQQSVAGAARAPTGEVHIRGQHAEYTYYIDGVPVPAGISGSLNELFDPNVVNQIAFQTGGWDAEFGNKNAAIVDVNTRVPAGGLRGDASGFGGSFSTNGQTADASQNIGKFGWFVSGTRRETDMRQEPVVFDTLTRDAINFHNHGTDLFTFGKLQYLASAGDVINLDANWSRTRFEVPFDSAGGVSLDDHQQDMNSFVNLGWRHQFPGGTANAGSDLFVAGFYRRGSLSFTPGVNDTPSFVFFPDTNTAFNLSEDRNFNTTGIKADYTYRLSERLQFKVGGLASLTRGHEDFLTLDGSGNPGPASNSDLKGNDEWVYAQTVIAPTEKWELRTGVRFDNHEAPFAGSQNQVSPRVKLSFFPDAQTSLWAYYGRLFVPTNVEDLRAITSVAQGGVVAQPTLPERDHFFEVGVTHRFPAGLVAKLSAYRKVSSPGIDDNTVPGSTIITSVNINQVWINGVETVLEVRPPGPLSGYVNLALNHAYGRGPITGGFFPVDLPPGYFDLDHDQRLSGVASVSYADRHVFATATGLYGSGLTNGNEPDAATYGRGLFDFNRSIHVDPNFIMNASAGYLLEVGNVLLRPEIYVENLLDHKYLLKGAFFSGASVGRPRTVEIRLNAGL